MRGAENFRISFAVRTHTSSPRQETKKPFGNAYLLFRDCILYNAPLRGQTNAPPETSVAYRKRRERNLKAGEKVCMLGGASSM